MRMTVKAPSNKAFRVFYGSICLDNSRSEYRLIAFRRGHSSLSRWFD
jgi:hypothetical protein